jgi:hypothetical protein
MSRLDPIQYAERLYGAICAADFSPISFLAFGNAVKEGIAMRNMPRIAAEPFMRVVGDMLNLEEVAVEMEIAETVLLPDHNDAAQSDASPAPASKPVGVDPAAPAAVQAEARPTTRRGENKRRNDNVGNSKAEP